MSLLGIDLCKNTPNTTSYGYFYGPFFAAGTFAALCTNTTVTNRSPAYNITDLTQNVTAFLDKFQNWFFSDTSYNANGYSSINNVTTCSFTANLVTDATYTHNFTVSGTTAVITPPFVYYSDFKEGLPLNTAALNTAASNNTNLLDATTTISNQITNDTNTGDLYFNSGSFYNASACSLPAGSIKFIDGYLGQYNVSNSTHTIDSFNNVILGAVYDNNNFGITTPNITGATIPAYQDAVDNTFTDGYYQMMSGSNSPVAADFIITPLNP